MTSTRCARRWSTRRPHFSTACCATRLATTRTSRGRRWPASMWWAGPGASRWFPGSCARRSASGGSSARRTPSPPPPSDSRSFSIPNPVSRCPNAFRAISGCSARRGPATTSSSIRSCPRTPRCRRTGVRRWSSAGPTERRTTSDISGSWSAAAWSMDVPMATWCPTIRSCSRSTRRCTTETISGASRSAAGATGRRSRSATSSPPAVRWK